MKTDERAVTEALREIDVSVPADLATRVRRGGRRRLVRRRAYAVAGVAVVVAGAASAVVAVRSGEGSGAIEPTDHQHPAQRVYPGLYAAPPAPGTQCNSGDSGNSAPNGQSLASAYPQLLLLPPTGQQVSAYVRSQRWYCQGTHIALTAVKQSGDTVAQGLVVEGPNAPTAVEDGRAGPGIGFGGQTGHLAIQDQPATEFTITPSDHTDAYWTEPDGGQWHAAVRGMSQSQAVALLNGLTLNSRGGTAALPDAARNGWTVEPAATDVAPSDTGVVFADWTDGAGHRVDLTVTQGPDRVDQLAAGGPGGMYMVEGYGGPVQFTTVRGHDGLIGPGRTPLLFWQEAPDVQVHLSVTGGTTSEIEQIAESLVLASPGDPRFDD